MRARNVSAWRMGWGLPDVGVAAATQGHHDGDSPRSLASRVGKGRARHHGLGVFGLLYPETFPMICERAPPGKIWGISRRARSLWARHRVVLFAGKRAMGA
jgi:hypothetical protein